MRDDGGRRALDVQENSVACKDVGFAVFVEIEGEGCAADGEIDQVVGVRGSADGDGVEGSVAFSVVDAGEAFAVEEGEVDVAVAVEVGSGEAGFRDGVSAAEVDGGGGLEGSVAFSEGDEGFLGLP